MDGFRERVVRQRARFIEDYDDYVDQARLDLGKLFRIEDYPSKEDDLQGKFAIRYRITPVPDADHFIAQLASDDTERVKRDIERHIEEQLHGAVGDLYRRFGEAVERVSERLNEDDDGKPLVFRDTMISNIRDLVDVVPRLNIFGDDELAQPVRAGEGQDRERRAGFAQAVEDLRPGGPRPGEARRGRARGEVRGVFRTTAKSRPNRAGAGGRLMAARVLGESALRVSDCVTELLRKQPFFGSLVLRLPLRPDPTRETLATDGLRDPLFAPNWVAETDAHLIETAMARVVMACALKHHTRRASAIPSAGRWPRSSSPTRSLRDAGFTLPPDAEAWDDLSVEQAYDRLPAPGGRRFRGRRRRSVPGAGAASARRQLRNPHPGRRSRQHRRSRPMPPMTETGQDGKRVTDPDKRRRRRRTRTRAERWGRRTARRGCASPMRRRATIRPAPARSWTPAPAPARTAPMSPARRPVDVAAEEQAWDEAMHQALNIARAEGKVPGRSRRR